jgi:Cdc6-like AAA superfamily ATPase
MVESAEFKAWLNGTPRTLFCQGMPGAGKTVMASTIVHHLQTTFPAGEVGIACIYCSRQETQGAYQHSTTNLLGAIIRQFEESRPSDLLELKELRARFRDRRRGNLLSSFTSILKTRMAGYTRAFLVVDGLDECSSDTRDELLRVLQQLDPKVNLALTSRDITTQEADFENLIRVEIRAQPEDLTEYVNARIQSSQYLRKHIEGDAKLRTTLHASIEMMVNGM